MRFDNPRYRPVLILLALMSAALACSLPGQGNEQVRTPVPEPSLVGTWVHTEGEHSISFIFDADGSYTMLMDGNAVVHGQYALLETIDPPGLNLIDEDGSVIYTIYQFISPDEVLLENNLPGAERPLAFSDAMLCTRVEP